MNHKSFRYHLILTFLFSSYLLQAQSLKQVLFSTGGTFLGAGNKVKLYSYDPTTTVATIIDSVYGDFSNELITDSGFAYLHVGRASGSSSGEDMIIKYDLNTHQRIDSITNIPGVQKFIVTPSYLVVTFGYGATSDYVRFYSKSSLDLVYSDNTITDMTIAATYVNDSVYVGFNRNDTGAVAVYSVSPLARQRIAWFDTLSAGINSMGNDGSSIYLLGERFNFVNFSIDYGNITRYNPVTNTRQSVVTTEAHALIAIRQDTIIAEFGASNTNAYHASTLAPLSFDIQRIYSEGVFDNNSEKYYLQETDYFSYGRLVELGPNGSSVLNNIPTDISGSAIALDHFGSPVSIKDHKHHSLTVFPNPATTHLSVSLNDKATYTILNAAGQTLLSGSLDPGELVSIEELAAGVYIINLTAGNFHEVTRFVKQ